MLLFINIIGLTLLAIFMLFLLNKHEKKTGDRLLVVIIIAFACYFLSEIWIQIDLNAWSFAFQSLFSFYILFPFILYALLLIDDEYKIKPVWWWLGSYDVVYTVFIISDLLILNDYTTAQIRELYEAPPLIYHIFYKGHMLYSIGVLIWYLRKLKVYQLKIRDYYSNIEQIRFEWLKYFSWSYLTVNSLSMAVFLPYNFGYIASIEIPFLVINAAFVLWLFYFIYHGIKQYTRANFQSQEKTTATEATKAEKYQSSSLSDNEMDGLYDQVKDLFETEQVFHNPELKIQHLAEMLNVTVHNISQTINSKSGKSFYDLVNLYRVEQFKELLCNPEKNRFTILALGFESGFNSKASMNRIFKQHVGQTPKEYKLAHA
ncbi:MAG: helix-turn-helix domain-containing protein [Reichenbachiella sp.]|uniref:helix-turn-helix domain-containing protein n=1 Tax=Reichenbachiella sp. TaxID=2184521 RepID=UPI003265AD32